MSEKSKTPWVLITLVVGAFLLVGGVWATFIVLAANNPVEHVPLESETAETSGTHP